MFSNRTAAGVELGPTVAQWLRDSDIPLNEVVVLGLPRGGVPVAAAVARALGAPVDVVVVRKLGVPYQPELAMGAIGEGGVRILNDDVIRLTMVREAEVQVVEKKGRRELANRLERLRGHRPGVDLRDRTAVIVDDGIATGATARAAIAVCRARGARRVVLAAPVGADDTVEMLRTVTDGVLCLLVPHDFGSVGRWYTDFTPVTDDDVRQILDNEAEEVAGLECALSIPVPGAELQGLLSLPPRASGIVLFAHGSGSSRHSPRNRFVADRLQRAGMGTLLFDLLTPTEERQRANAFDIELLSGRLAAATRWLRNHPYGTGQPVGYFGASTGAAAALWASTEPGNEIRAIVSRGGRPDLAAARLGLVRAPTLLLVGSLDNVVIDLNRQASTLMTCESELAIVDGATHLFEEPGTLAEVADRAAAWFAKFLGAGYVE